MESTEIVVFIEFCIDISNPEFVTLSRCYHREKLNECYEGTDITDGG